MESVLSSSEHHKIVFKQIIILKDISSYIEKNIQILKKNIYLNFKLPS